MFLYLILKNYNLSCKLVFLINFKIFLLGEWLKMSLRLLYKQDCCKMLNLNKCIKTKPKQRLICVHIILHICHTQHGTEQFW